MSLKITEYETMILVYYRILFKVFKIKQKKDRNNLTS